MSRRRTTAIVSAVAIAVLVADIVLVNLVGELPSGAWWFLAVPVGLGVVPVIAVVSLVGAVGAGRR